MDLALVLSPERIAVGMPASSKKRLLERMTELLLKPDTPLESQTVAQILIERERLGSTGIGHGVALPHGRVPGLARPVGAFATLAQGVDFDAIDGDPITMVFALLVPQEATDAHLRILAHLATMFSDPALREELLHAEDPKRLFARLTAKDGPPPAPA